MTGQTTLITRPAQQATGLQALLGQHGLDSQVFPVIEISPKNIEPKERAILEKLTRYDLAFFISANAVHQSMPLISKYVATLDHHVHIAVVGPATKAALETYALEASILSQQKFTSEGLLAHPALQAVAGKKVVIFRGVGGRTVLADTLKKRGAKVDSVVTYQRCIPEVDARPIITSLQAQNYSTVVVMSNESLDNLCQLLGGAEVLKHTPLVVISERTAKRAKDLGLSAIIAPSPSDADVCDCIRKLAR